MNRSDYVGWARYEGEEETLRLETCSQSDPGSFKIFRESATLHPWMVRPLDEWSIVGMNHYHVNGQKCLFVSMEKNGKCIKEEGVDDQYLWNRLWHKAQGA